MRWFFLVLFVWLNGCSLLPKPSLTVKVNTAATINPNDHYQSLPLVLRVYQLSDANAFSYASFDDLWYRDSETLSRDLLTSQEILLLNRQHKKIHLRRDRRARYLAFVAGFRRPVRRQWRAITELGPALLDGLRGVDLYINNNQIQVRR